MSSMYSPSLEEIKELRRRPENADKNMVPVCLDVVADLDTPVSIFLKLRSKQSKSFLLESVSLGENSSISRYSFIGSNPFQVLETGPNTSKPGDPLRHLQQEMANFRPIKLPNSSIPMTGGAVGYCSFDAVAHFEPKLAPYLAKQKDVLQVPESMYMFFDSVIVFDHAFHCLKIISHVRFDQVKDDNDLELAYEQAIRQINELNGKLDNALPETVGRRVLNDSQGGSGSTGDMKVDWEKSSNVGKQGYMDFVTKLKEHIVDGDIFQAVPSQRLSVPLPSDVSAFDLYRQMRVINPSPYMFYLELGDDFQIVGASPEMLVKVNHQREVEMHPIAGTRHRGRTEEEDKELAQDLLSDEKERAEHIMLVDLGRNDVGRVAEPGTVRVSELMKIEKYSHVMHIVSVVKGQLKDNKCVYDAYRAVFPAGTLSGAPKVRAMELISGLETERRGVYSGSVGYFSFSGFLDTAIAIRTIVVRNGNAYCQAGGGIVYDSDPFAEYTETVNKMRSAVHTIEKAIKAKKLLLNGK